MYLEKKTDFPDITLTPKFLNPTIPCSNDLVTKRHWKNRGEKEKCWSPDSSTYSHNVFSPINKKKIPLFRLHYIYCLYMLLFCCQVSKGGYLDFLHLAELQNIYSRISLVRTPMVRRLVRSLIIRTINHFQAKFITLLDKKNLPSTISLNRKLAGSLSIR